MFVIIILSACKEAPKNDTKTPNTIEDIATTSPEVVQQDTIENPLYDPSNVFDNGKWMSTDDPKSGIEIKDDTWIMFYKGETTTENDYYKPIVSRNTELDFLQLDLVNTQDTLSYAIVKNDGAILELSYLGRGNTLTYKRAGSLMLESFKVFPPAIDGCACYFSVDESSFQNGVYIYTDNYQDLAFIKFYGTFQQFKLSSTESISETETKQVWKSDNYLLTITTDEVGQLDETWQRIGTLELRDAKTNQLLEEKNLYGECGC